MRKIINYIIRFIKGFNIVNTDWVYEEYEKVGKHTRCFSKDLQNLTPEQQRIINAVFVVMSYYYLNYQYSYYHPYPNMFEVLKKKYWEIKRKYKLQYDKTDPQYYYECFKKELVKYSNLEELYSEYYNEKEIYYNIKDNQ